MSTRVIPFPKAFTFERLRLYVVVLVGLVCLGNCGITAGLAYFAVGVAVRPLPVILRDADGRAMVLRETSLPGNERPEVWKTHFLKTFVRRFVAIDSATVDEDLAEALNMMSPNWREYLLADEEKLDKRRRFRGGADVKARPDEKLVVRVSDSKTEPGTYFGAAYGPMHFTPRLEALEPKTLWFYTWIQFRSAPMTEINPYGYEVTAEETRWFESAALLDAHLELEDRR